MVLFLSFLQRVINNLLLWWNVNPSASGETYLSNLRPHDRLYQFVNIFSGAVKVQEEYPISFSSPSSIMWDIIAPVPLGEA